MEHSLLINFLFTEKSKYVRKVVETLFNLLINSKSIESLNNNKFEIKIKEKNDLVITSVKEALMIHILNNYKKIYDGQVYEEFFNLFGNILQCEKGNLINLLKPLN